MWRNESKQLSLAEELAVRRAGQKQRLERIDQSIS